MKRRIEMEKNETCLESSPELLDCPKRVPGTKQVVDDGTIQFQTDISCSCRSADGLVPVQWYSADEEKIGGANLTAVLSLKSVVHGKNNFSCRYDEDNDNRTAQYYAPAVAHGPTDAGVFLERTDDQNASSTFIRCSSDENGGVVVECFVTASNVWPVPLFRITETNGDLQEIHYSTDNLFSTGDDYRYRYRFDNNATGDTTIVCRAYNSLFPRDLFAEATLKVTIEDQSEMTFQANNYSSCPNNVVEVNADQEILFKCVAYFGLHQLIIYEDDTGTIISQGQSNREISATKLMQCADMGRYVCILRPTQGVTIEQRVIAVNVRCAITFPAYVLQNQTHDTEAEAFSIEIRLLGFPDPNYFAFYWKSDGSDWTTLDVITYAVSVQRSNRFNQAVTLLLSFNVDRDHFEGQYRLSISNGIGDVPAEYWFQLARKSSPDDSSSSSSDSVAIGIGIAAPVVVVVVFLLVFLICRARNKARSKAPGSKARDKNDSNYNSSVATVMTSVGSLRSHSTQPEGTFHTPFDATSNTTENTDTTWAPSGHPFEAAQTLYNLRKAGEVQTISEAGGYEEPHVYEELPENMVHSQSDSNQKQLNRPRPHRISIDQLSQEDREAGYIQPI